MLLSAALVILFRAREIERLARPESFAYVYDYARYLSIPAHPLLPTHLFLKVVVFLARGGEPDVVIDLGLFLSCAGAVVTLAYWTSEAFCLRSYMNALVSSRLAKSDLLGSALKFIPDHARFLVLKEAKNLKRDTLYLVIYVVRTGSPRLVLICDSRAKRSRTKNSHRTAREIRCDLWYGLGRKLCSYACHESGDDQTTTADRALGGRAHRALRKSSGTRSSRQAKAAQSLSQAG